MREGWEVKTLGAVCIIDKTKYSASELPFVGLEDIQSNAGPFIGDLTPRGMDSSTFHFSNIHLLYGRLRPYLNKVLLPDFEGHCSSEIFPLLAGDALDRRYLYYWLTSEPLVEKINQTCTGARMPRANVKEVLEFEIPLPPLAEQKRIVGVLDQAFAGIEQALAAARKNLANARELFETTLNTTFTQKGKGWVETTLGETCEFANGKAHEKDIDENGQFIVVNSKFISQEGRVIKKTNEMKHPLFIDDIVMVMSDVPKGKALAKCFLIRENNKYSLNQRICSIRSENYLPKFLVYQLSRHPYLLAFDNKGSQANLRKADILSCPLFLPCRDDQKSIVLRLDTLSTQTQALEALYQQKIDALNELKQSLLQKAFAGELTATQEVAA